MYKFDKILIGIAFSPNLKPNIFEAVRLANLFNAELIGVHAGNATTEKKKLLKNILKEADKLNNSFTSIWKEGKPDLVITEVCKKENIKLLILGALQIENIYKYYVGSIARKITRKAPCSVLLLIKPSLIRVHCKHIVVNGLESKYTKKTLETAFLVSNNLNCKKITIVEEIKQDELSIKINDDRSLRKVNIAKERLEKREKLRVNEILKEIDNKNITIKFQSIFGKRGYSIGHYAKVKRADLLIMNAPKKTGIIDRIFPHDIEYILAELPTDVLIVK